MRHDTFYCIVKRSGEVLYRDGVQTHEELIEIFGLVDDTADTWKMTFARVRMFASGHIDRNYMMEPLWFNERHERAALAALKQSRGGTK